MIAQTMLRPVRLRLCDTIGGGDGVLPSLIRFWGRRAKARSPTAEGPFALPEPRFLHLSFARVARHHILYRD